MRISALPSMASHIHPTSARGEAHCCGAEQELPVDSFVPTTATDSNIRPGEARRTELGQSLWQKYLDSRIDLLPIQVSGRNDGADARSNIADTALGRQAKRSSYETAPGGRVSLSFALLEGLESLSNDFSFRVTSLAGGSHSSRSRHYLGVGMDVDTIDGVRVDKDHPRFQEFMAQARALGATEVLGPGARGHDRHIHIAWPRDATA